MMDSNLILAHLKNQQKWLIKEFIPLNTSSNQWLNSSPFCDALNADLKK